MKRRDDGNAYSPGCARRDDAERGIQAAVHMDDIEPLLAKQLLEPGRQPQTDGNPRHSPIRVNHETRADAPYVGMFCRLAAPRSPHF